MSRHPYNPTPILSLTDCPIGSTVTMNHGIAGQWMIIGHRPRMEGGVFPDSVIVRRIEAGGDGTPVPISYVRQVVKTPERR